MFSRVCLTLLIVAFTSAAYGDPLYAGDPAYRVTPCNRAGQPACNVQYVKNPQPVPGLNNALFQSFFGSLGFPGGSTGTYTWSVTDVNSSGIAIGQVRDLNILIVTAFVFDQGALICCTHDRLFLDDINDNGFLVGHIPIGGAGGEFLAYCCGQLNNGQSPLALSFVPNTYSIFSFNAFLGIDDSERILATSNSQQEYELDPAPEPKSLLLFTTAVGSIVFLVQRRKSSRRV